MYVCVYVCVYVYMKIIINFYFFITVLKGSCNCD